MILHAIIALSSLVFGIMNYIILTRFVNLILFIPLDIDVSDEYTNYLDNEVIFLRKHLVMFIEILLIYLVFVVNISVDFSLGDFFINSSAVFILIGIVYSLCIVLYSWIKGSKK